MTDYVILEQKLLFQRELLEKFDIQCRGLFKVNKLISTEINKNMIQRFGLFKTFVYRFIMVKDFDRQYQFDVKDKARTLKMHLVSIKVIFDDMLKSGVPFSKFECDEVEVKHAHLLILIHFIERGDKLKAKVYRGLIKNIIKLVSEFENYYSYLHEIKYKSNNKNYYKAISMNIPSPRIMPA